MWNILSILLEMDAELEDDLDDDMESERNPVRGIRSVEDDPMGEEEDDEESHSDEDEQTTASPTLKYNEKRRVIETKIDNGEQIGYSDFVKLVT